MISLCRPVALLILVSTAFGAERETKDKVPSPDGKFVFEFVGPSEDPTWGSWKIVENDSGKMLWKSPDDANVTWVRNAQCVWAPNSQQFALNYQAGSRYEVTRVYRRKGDAFDALPSFESLLAARLEKSKKRQLSELVDKLPSSFPERNAVLEGSFQRRLWDQYRVERWIDDDTLEVAAYSIRHITTPDGTLDDEEILASFRFVVRRDRDNWRIVEEQAVPVRETE